MLRPGAHICDTFFTMETLLKRVWYRQWELNIWSRWGRRHWFSISSILWGCHHNAMHYNTCGTPTFHPPPALWHTHLSPSTCSAAISFSVLRPSLSSSDVSRSRSLHNCCVLIFSLTRSWGQTCKDRVTSDHNKHECHSLLIYIGIYMVTSDHNKHVWHSLLI